MKALIGKLSSFSLSQIRKGLAILLLLIWIFLSAKMIHSQIREAITVLPELFALTLEQKNELIDGDFYRFMMLCKKRIPPGEDIIFKVTPDRLKVRSREWYVAEYFISKSSYYLYPCKIYRVEYAIPGIRYQISFDTTSGNFNLIYRGK